MSKWKDFREELLSDSETKAAYDRIIARARRIVLAWDPDFTKLTEAEALSLQQAEEELARGETVSHDAINWDE